MFDQTVRYYDLIYSVFKDYAAEAAKIQELIERLHPAARSILDVACGTGEHARFLASRYAVDGLDLEPGFVEIARRKVKSGCFTVADMRAFALDKQFDVVLCLFSSIGYLTRGEDVVRALRCFHRHLAPGGVVIVEAWFTPEQWSPGKVFMNPVKTEEISICRMSYSGQEGQQSVIQFHYLVGGPSGLLHLQETHRLGLYTEEQMCDFFIRAGLSPTLDRQGLSGRGLYTARPALPSRPDERRE